MNTLEMHHAETMSDRTNCWPSSMCILLVSPLTSCWFWWMLLMWSNHLEFSEAHQMQLPTLGCSFHRRLAAIPFSKISNGTSKTFLSICQAKQIEQQYLTYTSGLLCCHLGRSQHRFDHGRLWQLFSKRLSCHQWWKERWWIESGATDVP